MCVCVCVSVSVCVCALFISFFRRGDDEGEGVCQYLSMTDQLRIGLRHLGWSWLSFLFHMHFTRLRCAESTVPILYTI